MSLSYGREQLGLAVDALATGSWPLNARLRDAYVSSLMHVNPAEDLPVELSEDFFVVKHKLSHLCRSDAESNGGKALPVDEVFRDLDEMEAKLLARKVVSLYRRLLRTQ